MENYVFYLVDETELRATTPPTPCENTLIEWAMEHGSKWSVVRQRASSLWDAIASVDSMLGANLRFEGRVSIAEIGPPWGSIPDVGYFDTETVTMLAPVFLRMAARTGDNPAHRELVDALGETFETAAQRRMAVLLFRA